MTDLREKLADLMDKTLGEMAKADTHYSKVPGILADAIIAALPGMANAPDRILMNEDPKHDGQIDEIVVHNCTAHLEKLGKDSFFLGLSRSDDLVRIWIERMGKRVHASAEVEGSGLEDFRAAIMAALGVEGE